MDQHEDFIIDRPYQTTYEDEADISKASPYICHKEDWTSTHLDGFKNHLRDYLREKQHRRCAYCRQLFREGQAPAEIEHIVPKDKKPDWMYETFNLCLSCKMCNIKKGHTKPIIRDESAHYLPKLSDDYLIVHPYLDQYSQHIELVNDILYKGMTEKGRYTIEVCGLNRYMLAIDRAEEKVIQDSSSYVKLMLALEDENHKILVDNIDKIIAYIKERIEEYKERNST